MSATYFDASAFVKLVVEEPESRALRSFLMQRDSSRMSSALLRAEAVRAIRSLGQEATAGLRDSLRRIGLISIDDRILEAAGNLDPKVVRTLDAIHLATALALGDDLDLVLTYDTRMQEGARLLGLRWAAPGR